MQKNFFFKALFVLFVFLFFFVSVQAGVPKTITIQGRLEDNGVLATGLYDMTFKIYDVSTGGTALYSESHTGANKVSVVNGFFSTTIGKINSINLPFDKQYWLGISVGLDPEMTPRIELTSVPYAITALDLNVSEDLNIDAGTLYVDISNNRVGIGTTSPQTKFHIVDGTNDYRFTATSQAPLSLTKSDLSTSNGRYAFNIGQARTTNNSANFRYTHTGAGATTNYVGIGFWGNDDILNVVASGNVGIGTTNPGYKLHVVGGSNIGSIGTQYGIQVTQGDPGVLIEKRYAGRTNDRYGVGQYSGGVTRLYAADYYSPASVRLGFATGETSFRDILTVTHAGNVGIGTTSPAYKLDVSGAVNATTYYGDGSNLTGIVSGLWSQVGTDINYNDGNVGINVTSPSSKFHVVGDVNLSSQKSSILLTATGNILLNLGVGGSGTGSDGNAQSPSNWAFSGSNLYYNQGNVGIKTNNPNEALTVGGVLSLGKTSVPSATLGYGKIYVKPDGNIYFKDENGTETPLLGGGSSAVWKTSGSSAYYTTGNVGIGTTSPTAKLDVFDGNVSFNSGQFFFNRDTNRVGIGTTSPSEKVEISGGNLKFTTENTGIMGTQGSRYLYQSGGSTYLRLAGSPPAKLYISDDKTNDVIIASGGGNVGIGTTSPGYKLDVNGSVKANGFVNSNGKNVGIAIFRTQKATGSVGCGGTYIGGVTFQANSGDPVTLMASYSGRPNAWGHTYITTYLDGVAIDNIGDESYSTWRRTLTSMTNMVISTSGNHDYNVYFTCGSGTSSFSDGSGEWPNGGFTATVIVG